MIVSLDQARVAINAGHGYDPLTGIGDPGAVGPTGRKEADNTLVIAQKVNFYLQKAGITKILMTRDRQEYESLQEIINEVNAFKPHIFISIHNNASDSASPNYNSIWVCKFGGQAELLAKKINDNIKIEVPWPNSGVRQANFLVLTKTEPPAVLVECGFISNWYEEKRLGDEDIRDRFARAIANGAIRYFMEEAA